MPAIAKVLNGQSRPAIPRRRHARRPRTLTKSQIFTQDVPTKPLFKQVVFDIRDQFSGLNV